MLNAEFNYHMCYEKHDNKINKSNYRNGHSSKTVKTSQGNINVKIPRDRNASFEPVVIKKG